MIQQENWIAGNYIKDEDELIGVRLTDGEDNVVLVTKMDYVLHLMKRCKTNWKSSTRCYRNKTRR